MWPASGAGAPPPRRPDHHPGDRATADEREAMIMALAENVAREDLNAVERRAPTAA